MTYNSLTAIFMASLSLVATSCEKPLVDTTDEVTTTGDGSQNIRLNITNIEDAQYGGDTPTRSSSDQQLSDLCSKISLAVFDSSGAKKLTSNQNSTAKDFGCFDISLDKGNYTIVLIAHNGTANATISSPEEVKFANNKVTDTFYYCGEITVDDNEEYDIAMTRATAMFRLVVNDNTPKAVKSMKFYYTGGSSTFDATSGYGCVNSKQTELREVDQTAYNGASQYEVYTFPHEEGKKVKFEISALNGTSTNSTELYKQTIDNVDMKRNVVSQYSGYFFGENPSGGRGFNIHVDSQWQYEYYEY